MKSQDQELNSRQRTKFDSWEREGTEWNGDWVWFSWWIRPDLEWLSWCSFVRRGLEGRKTLSSSFFLLFLVGWFFFGQGENFPLQERTFFTGENFLYRRNFLSLLRFFSPSPSEAPIPSHIDSLTKEIPYPIPSSTFSFPFGVWYLSSHHNVICLPILVDEKDDDEDDEYMESLLSLSSLGIFPSYRGFRGVLLLFFRWNHCRKPIQLGEKGVTVRASLLGWILCSLVWSL